MTNSREVSVNKSYEHLDHRFRTYDQYALAKYDITLRWLKACGSLQGTKLLNVGCGAGLFNRLAAQAGARVVGIEPDCASLDLAREEAAGYDIELRHGDVFSIKTDEQFDVIVIHDVLEHIKDDERVLEYLSQLLSEEGRVVISVPALPILFGFHDENLGHYRRYTKYTLARVMRAHFTLVRSRYFGASFVPVVALLSVLLRRPYPLKAATTGLRATALRFICQCETHLPLPFGTSLLVEAKRR